jgi:hypothetical protein
VVGIIEADGDEFRHAADRRADPRLAVDGGQLGGIERGEFGERGRRIGLAVKVLHMGGEVAQLTRFVDQAGLFLALGPVTNKLHVSLPFEGRTCLDASWNSGRGNSMADCAPHCRPAA